MNMNGSKRHDQYLVSNCEKKEYKIAMMFF